MLVHRAYILVSVAHFLPQILAVSQGATCYAPDGEAALGNYPCFLDQAVSPCCGGGYICEASGLCKVVGSQAVSDLIRGTCTDSTWKSTDCPQYCTSNQPQELLCYCCWRWTAAATGGTILISCQNVTNSDLDFCCDHTDGCCDSGIGRFRVPSNTDIVTLGTYGATISTSAPATSSSATSSSSPSSISKTPNFSSISGTSSTVPNTTTSTATNTSSSPGLSTGARAGIGVSCGITGLTLISGLIYFCLRRRKLPIEPTLVQNLDMSYELRQHEPQELYTLPTELHGSQATWTNPPAELPAGLSQAWDGPKLRHLWIGPKWSTLKLSMVGRYWDTTEVWTNSQPEFWTAEFWVASQFERPAEFKAASRIQRSPESEEASQPKWPD